MRASTFFDNSSLLVRFRCLGCDQICLSIRKISAGTLYRNKDGLQPLGQRSAYNTIIADPGNPYVATFYCTICFLFTSRIFYRFFLRSTSLLRLQTKTSRKNSPSPLRWFSLYNSETSTSPFSGRRFSRGEKNECRKSWHKLECPRRFLRFKYHSVELG